MNEVCIVCKRPTEKKDQKQVYDVLGHKDCIEKTSDEQIKVLIEKHKEYKRNGYKIFCHFCDKIHKYVCVSIDENTKESYRIPVCSDHIKIGNKTVDTWANKNIV